MVHKRTILCQKERRFIHIKFKIIQNTTGEKLKNHVPPRYKGIIPSRATNNGITAIVFLNDEVILSSSVKKAIKKLNFVEGNRKVAIGFEFTIESKGLFRENDFEVIYFKDFGWTDERYIEIHQRYFLE